MKLTAKEAIDFEARDSSKFRSLLIRGALDIDFVERKQLQWTPWPHFETVLVISDGERELVIR